jgi:hypothetical protein
MANASTAPLRPSSPSFDVEIKQTKGTKQVDDLAKSSKSRQKLERHRPATLLLETNRDAHLWKCTS